MDTVQLLGCVVGGCVVGAMVLANLILLAMWRAKAHALRATREELDRVSVALATAERDTWAIKSQHSQVSHSNATSMRERDEARSALAAAERKLHETEQRLEQLEARLLTERKHSAEALRLRDDCQQQLEAIKMVLAGQLSVDDADEDDD